MIRKMILWKEISFECSIKNFRFNLCFKNFCRKYKWDFIKIFENDRKMCNMTGISYFKIVTSLILILQYQTYHYYAKSFAPTSKISEIQIFDFSKSRNI